MGRILSEESTLSRQKRKLTIESRSLQWVLRGEAILAVFLLLVGTIYWGWRGEIWPLGAAAVVAFLATAHWLKIRENEKDVGALSAGLKGEIAVTRALQEGLPNDCYIFNDLTVRRGWHSAQIDHLVVTPRGIFLIETKNWRGQLVGHEKDARWKQFKEGVRGPIYLANPIRQSLRHVEIFRRWLIGRGIHWLDVFPVLVMMAPGVQWEIEGATIPVLRPQEAVKFVATHRGTRTYSEQEVDAVLNHLMKLTH